ncbi:MAG: ribbon-helix-helix protein, CopG family [Solirubrobacterales bacterium]
MARPEFAREIKELADRDGRSVSNLIRVALRDRLSSATSPTTGKARRRAALPRSAGAAPDALGKGEKRRR